jgi:hypothetical protein
MVVLRALTELPQQDRVWPAFPAFDQQWGRFFLPESACATSSLSIERVLLDHTPTRVLPGSLWLWALWEEKTEWLLFALWFVITYEHRFQILILHLRDEKEAKRNNSTSREG